MIPCQFAGECWAIPSDRVANGEGTEDWYILGIDESMNKVGFRSFPLALVIKWIPGILPKFSPIQIQRQKMITCPSEITKKETTWFIIPIKDKNGWYFRLKTHHFTLN